MFPVYRLLLSVRRTNFGGILPLALFLIGIVELAIPSFAQLSTASITGVVRDPSGSPIPNAKIVVTNTDTGVQHPSQTNNAGNYLVLSLTPGHYSLRVTADGFQAAENPSITLEVNQTATIDVTMKVGSLQQTMTVEAAGELVQASTAELGGVVAEKQVVDLPLNGRNFTQLLSLTPGVSPVNVSQNAGGFGNVFSGQQFEFPSINGQTNRSNFFLTDGLINQGAFSSIYAVPPIIDSIQEFKVNSHADQAEFGGVTGGVINVATKSGTNDLHGTAWEFLRNSAVNARNPFQTSVTPFRQNQFGGSLGGPVMLPKLWNGRKMKTFFFGAYEGIRFSQAANSFLHLPTDAELAGNLAGEAQAYNPFTTRPDPNHPGGFIRDPFPGNQIPASLINMPLVDLAKKIRPVLFNTGVGNNNAEDNTPFIQTQNEFDTRVDQTFGDRDFVWFRYSGLYYDTSSSGGIPTYTNHVTNNPAQNYGISWVHTFSPTLVLQAQYGRTHQETNSSTVYNGIPSSTFSSLGFSPNFAGNFIGGFSLLPSIGIAGYSSPIPGTGHSFNPNETNIHEWKANMSKIIGNHTLRWGGEVDGSTFESLYANANSGFAYQQTDNPADPSLDPGNAMASFLLNVVDNAGRRNVHETTRWGGVMGYYFQDSWKASSRLTVNLGIRYDRTFVPPYGLPSTVGQNGGIETGDLNLNNGTYIVQQVPPPCSVRGHAPCIPGDGTLPAHVVAAPDHKIIHDTTNNWAPRVGLAYRLTDTTVIRSGFGIFYDNWAAVNQISQNYEGAWPDVGQQLGNNLNVPTTANPLPTVTGFNPFAAGAGLFPAATPFNQVQWFMDPYIKNPYSMQWNFGIAKELNSTTTVTLDYVGSGDRRTDVGGYNNVALTPGPGNPTLRQPYPYIHPTFYDKSIGRADYEALQFLLTKRFSHGLTYQISYTWSKAIDIGSDGWFGVEGQAVQNPYDLNANRSVAGFDVPQLLSVNITYELPFGTGKEFATGNWFVDHVIGGWQVNMITTARSGVPYNLSVPGDIANTGDTGYLRPNLVGNATLSNPTAKEYFNTAAFAIPPQYTFGNLGRFALRGSAFWDIDSSLFRDFTFFENKTLEFRFESFNTPNTKILGNPNGNILDPNFGVVTGTANAARSLQFAAKIIF
jgi:hypothetical protein